ncbi:helix-turn-helix transcriptional regulator [Kitasatospora sp. NPDC002965]|uniref:helix-turn-helix transcriptional regulator n=1 Tax=Kitasatospora sp. NPDC002965 TaxID=3154775 RepID=UPI0033A64A59
MAKEKILPPGKSPREFYGSELKRLRESATPRMSQEKLGAMTFVSGAYIGLLETAVRVPQIDLSLRIDEALSTGGVLERLHDLLEFSRFADYFKEAAEFESQAVTISEFAALVVPGLLQTPEYARAIFLSAQPLLTEDELNNRIAARMERTNLVADPDGPKLWYILDEAVIRRTIGSQDIMAAQLHHVAELIKRRRVIVQIAPFDRAHALLEGILSLMTFLDAPPLAYIEGPHAGQLIDDYQLFARCQESYDLARAAALSPEASLALLLSAAEEHENARD